MNISKFDQIRLEEFSRINYLDMGLFRWWWLQISLRLHSHEYGGLPLSPLLGWQGNISILLLLLHVNVFLGRLDLRVAFTTSLLNNKSCNHTFCSL
jgi:hypothetical protein